MAVSSAPVLRYLAPGGSSFAPLLLVVLFAAHFYYQIYDAPPVSPYCPLGDVGDILNWSADCYWSRSYADAREKFRALGRALRATQGTTPFSPEGKGKMTNREGNATATVNEDSGVLTNSFLFRSYAIGAEVNDNASPTVDTSLSILPGRDTMDAIGFSVPVSERAVSKSGTESGSAESVLNLDLVLSSGTHGVEGYAGSAIQLEFLHAALREAVEDSRSQRKVSSKDPKNGGKRRRRVLLLHAVSPFAMRHNRRFNEHNVDLNRNALTPADVRFVNERGQNFAGYNDLRYLFTLGHHEQDWGTRGGRAAGSSPPMSWFG